MNHEVRFRKEESPVLVTVFGMEIPVDLSELLRPSMTALLVIDMQNDYCSPRGAASRSGRDMSGVASVAGRIRQFATRCREIGVQVIHSQNIRLPDGRSDSPSWLRLRMRVAKNFSGVWRDTFDATIQGTWGAEFIAELQPEPGELVVPKFRSSALHGTSLDLLLRVAGIRAVLVAGCTTEGCVESTVRDLGFHDYFPIVLSDCVASDNPELHRASMLAMSAYRADVVDSVQVLDCWKRSARIEPAES